LPRFEARVVWQIECDALAARNSIFSSERLCAMGKRRKAQDQRDTVTDVSADVAVAAPSSRRWILLVAGAVCIGVLAAYGVALLSSSDPERDRLEDSIADLAVEVSPDAASLLGEAGEVADAVLERFPYSGDALSVVAQLYHELGKTDDAVRCWKRCIELDPALATSSHAAIGAVAFEKGELEEAAEHYRAAMKLEPESSTHPVHLAEALIYRGQYEEAVEILETNLKAHPRSMPANVLIGQALFELQQHEKARRHLEVAVELGPNFTNAYYTLARACAALGDKEKSNDYLKRFKELQAQEEQQHRDALKKTRETDEIRRAVAQLYTSAAQVYVGHGDVQTAEEHLLRAGELAPHGADCRSLLAWLYEKQGRTDEALRTLAEVGERAPDDLSAQLSIAAVYAKLGQFYEAETAYRKAIELTPHQPGAYAALADLYLKAGRKLPEAKALAVKAALMEPVAKHYFLLSLACLRTGDRAAALSAIEQAIALDGDNTQYRELHQTIRKQQ